MERILGEDNSKFWDTTVHRIKHKNKNVLALYIVIKALEYA